MEFMGWIQNKLLIRWNKNDKLDLHCMYKITRSRRILHFTRFALWLYKQKHHKFRFKWFKESSPDHLKRSLKIVFFLFGLDPQNLPICTFFLFMWMFTKIKLNVKENKQAPEVSKSFKILQVKSSSPILLPQNRWMKTP